ncbi:MAG TPA: hypothetical protein VNW54_02870 [Granulicella sp.]|jgi:hypothetical protein|nr:hypothetical protein [Granulicella sp.]
MVESVQTGLIHAAHVAQESELKRSPNGVRFAAIGENSLATADLEHLVQAVPGIVAAALDKRAFYFVPLALSEHAGDAPDAGDTLVALNHTPEWSEQAVCHRDVRLGELDAVFISTRLLADRFALAFEFFINVGHAFVDAAGIPERFSELVWTQALADVRGESSHDAWENRALALASAKSQGKMQIDEKAKTSFIEAAFADAVAIYQLSLAVDFDYAELREREYPLLAPQALAERLRLVARLFPPNPGYEFAIRYRRRN